MFWFVLRVSCAQGISQEHCASMLVFYLDVIVLQMDPHGLQVPWRGVDGFLKYGFQWFMV